MLSIDLDGRRALVTGASGGIGAGIVAVLREAGAEVVAHYRSDAAGAADAAGDAALTVHAELDAPGAAAALLDAAGPFDIIVHNAADQQLAPLAGSDTAVWERVLGANVTAAAELTRHAARRWIDGGRPGAVVAISSIEGLQPAPEHGVYAASKAALAMWVRAAAGEYGRHGIRVNAVSPGLVGRPGLGDAWPEGVARWHAAAPLARLGTPADIGRAVAFLASDLAAWITGANLVVDGGVLCRPTW
ncbi:MAG: SDR family oxidoreductase [Acidimicrobiales bacterium]